LGALADAFVGTDELHLSNVTTAAVAAPCRDESGLVDQWLVPAASRRSRDGLPGAATVDAVRRAVDQARPDVIHVWGTETFWGLLTARGLIPGKTLLETQGLKFAIAPVYAGGLGVSEQVAAAGVKEIVRRNTIPQARRTFERWGGFEQEMLSGHDDLTVQTDWLAAQVRCYNPTATLHRNHFALRNAFYAARPWQPGRSRDLFCSAAYSAPFKGLHVAVRALAMLRERHPDVRLRVAGAHLRPGLRRDGYIHWVAREARRLGVAEQIAWLGPLSAEQIVEELQSCAAMIVPSFMEGYCLGLAEAMLVGVPCVVSFAGGAACLAENGRSALYFTPGDVAMCAWQADRLLGDVQLAQKIAVEARAVAATRNGREQVARTQLAIYADVLGRSRVGERRRPAAAGAAVGLARAERSDRSERGEA
jgi:glycosyltransferase involved in cell wall biosynthesis